MLPAHLPLWLVPFTSIASAALTLTLSLFVGERLYPGVLDWFAQGSNPAILTGTVLVLGGFYLFHFKLLHAQHEQSSRH